MKKFIYVLIWVFLGIIISFIFHGVLEMVEIKYLLYKELVPDNITFLGTDAYCALPTIIQMLILVSGIVIGFWIGLYFWKRLYTKSGKLKKK